MAVVTGRGAAGRARVVGRRPTLVVLRALGLGDLLTGVPALRALTRAFPRHRRVLAAPAALGPLVGMVGGFHRLVPTGELQPLDRTLTGAAVAVDLHGRGPESQRLLLALGPERLISFAHPDVGATHGGPPWVPGEHEVLRWCRMLRGHGIPADPSDVDVSPPDLPVPLHWWGVTVVHPGAAAPARRWPVERFGAVVRAEVASGRRVVVTAGPGEEALAQRVCHAAGAAPGPAGTRVSAAAGTADAGTSVPGAARSGTAAVGAAVPNAAPAGTAVPVTLVAGRDLRGLASLVAVAARVVCGDTGVAHLATALGTPSVVLFGPVPPGEWGPPPDRPWHVALWAGRHGDPHGRTADPGLLDISVADVLRALGGLGGGRGSGGAEVGTVPA